MSRKLLNRGDSELQSCLTANKAFFNDWMKQPLVAGGLILDATEDQKVLKFSEGELGSILRNYKM